MERLIIIGSGPAGHTAAIYAARAELKPLMIEGRQPGGQLMLTTDVENWPGAFEGILGPSLMKDLKKQSERFGTRYVSDNVIKVDFSSSPFKIKTSDKEFETESVIIATGASARWLNIPGESEFQGRGVSACATCDGFFFKDKHVVVVGGGDSALEEATFLTKFASKVTVIVRKETLKASKIMQERAENNNKIEFIWNTEVKEVFGETVMNKLRLFNNKTQEESEFEANGMFVAIGHKPNTEVFKDKINLDKVGYVVTESGSSKTNVEGVFAAGDVADHIYRQAITAAGTGCMAALDTERYLAHKE